MIDQRRLRFADITGLERRDLPLATEIWLEDIFKAPWINRETMKLCAYFVRYMSRPDASALTLREIENQCQLSADDVRKCLVLMRTFGTAEAFVIDRSDIRVALRLSITQRLRTLEAKHRLKALLGEPVSNSVLWSTGDQKWLPDAAAAVKPAATPANLNGANAALAC